MTAAADTDRTPHSWDLRFLHLRVCPEDRSTPVRDLLLSDIPGETCKRATDSASECAKLGCLARADRVLIALDGNRLASPATRESVLSNGIALFRRLSESRTIRPQAPLDFVVTKWDLIVAVPAIDPVRAAMRRMKDQIGRLPIARDFDISWLETASRPKKLGLVGHCHGMEGFPRAWSDAVPPPDLSRHRRAASARLDMDMFVAAPALPAVAP